MAEIKIRLFDINSDFTEVESLLSFELSRSTQAACDGLRLRFLTENRLGELDRVEVYADGKRVFNGFVDTQRESENDGFNNVFIYARSTASLLVDNQARPAVYQNPCAKSLFIHNARELGFECALPDICCQSVYQVGMGTTCYGAINDFVCGITGRNIIVDPYNTLVLADDSTFADIGALDVLSERRVINRGGVLSGIDYKINSENDYVYHCDSRLAVERGIRRRRKMNLSSLASWQRKYTVSNYLRASSRSYYSYQLVVDGLALFELYSRAEYKGFSDEATEEYYIDSVCGIIDSKGSRTKITLNKSVDAKEIVYVD